MKKFFTLLTFMICMASYTLGQIVITEISYNPPEGGTDSLEYIEIYNASNAPLNLNGYKISKGVDFTFPDSTINAGQYFLVVKHARAFKTVYNITAAEWSPNNPTATNNTLANNGEVIEIVDGADNVLASLRYERLAPWPTAADGTDGAGASIELCDVSADPTLGQNWKASINELGFELNNRKVLGTPGFANSITACSEPPVTLYPNRTIVSVSTTNADGVLDSLNKTCTLLGTVYGVNLRPAGYQFTIIDSQNNGIGAYLEMGDLNYIVKEGDQVEIKGRVVQFNGFAQVELVEIKLISQNNTLVTPKIVDSFIEEDESSLVMLPYVSFKDPSEWTGTGSGFNVTMVNSSGHEFTVRIDNDIDAYGAPIPSHGSFFVIGLLGQFDSSLPYTEGYQLLPRYLVDFDPAGSTDNALDTNMKVMPNPTTHMLNIITDSNPERLELFNIQGQMLGQFFNTLNLDMSEHAKGIYFIKAVKGEKSSTLKVIKM